MAKLYEKYFNDAFQHYSAFNTWEHPTQGCSIPAHWVYSLFRKHVKRESVKNKGLVGPKKGLYKKSRTEQDARNGLMNLV